MFQRNLPQFQQQVPGFTFWGQGIGAIISSVINILLPLAGLILLLYLLWGGFSLMLSRGDPKAIESGKTKITNAVIGFVILFIAYWLVQLLGTVLGIKQVFQIFP